MTSTLSNLSSLKEKVSNALSKKNKERNDNKSKKNSKATNEPKVKSNNKTRQSKGEEEDHDEILRREALNLGATEDDIALVKDIDDGELSEQEFDNDKSSTKVDKNFTGELSDFMKSIGLNKHNANDVLVDDDEEEEEVPELVDEDEEQEEGNSSNNEKENVESSTSASSEKSDSDSDSEEDKDSEEDQEDQEDQEEKEEKEEESKQTGDTENHNEEKKSKHGDKVTNLQSVISDRLTVDPRSDWYNIPLDINNLSIDRNIKQSDIDELYEKAKSLIEEENRIYDEEFNKSSSQKRFLSQILTGGTLSDKISALTLLVQEAPLHNLRALDNLFNMCQKKSRTAALQCVDALADLLVNTILPSNRKLKPFKKQPLSKSLTDKQLILMYFEDHLKTMYFQFISLLEKLSHDPILYVRMKIVSHLFALVKAKPEQEANLLRLGVNKLGDTDNKVSSKTSYQILLLEQEHPAMKQIICEAVIDVIFRSNNDHHALYYSINTLNQTILTRNDEGLANKLVDAYFALFEKLLIKTDDQNVGQLKESEYQKEGRRKKNIKRGKKGGKSVKNEKNESEIIEEKNSKMFAQILTGLNRSFPFSNFPMDIFENHLNILYKITHSLNFNTSVQALILIQTITNKFSDDKFKDRFYRTLYESLWDERLLNSSKQGIYLNLLYKSLKNDENIGRVLAFVKRICQVCLNWFNIGTIAGMIFLLIQLEREIPQIRNLFLNTPMDDKLEEAEKEEIDEEKKQNKEETIIYDSKKRDPKFANADKSSIWEIEYFLKHYHPTIQLYAENFLKYDELTKEERKTITKPDLGLYSLSHFLDRFVYKKAKSKANLKGSSIMQPLGGAHTGNLLVRATGVESKDIPANTEDWLSKKANQIKPEDDFFYQYFSTKQEKLMNSKLDKEFDRKMKNGDEEAEDSELDEDSVWNALVKSNPEVEGDDLDDDLDDELSDLNMSDFSDEDGEEEEEEEGKQIDEAANDLEDSEEEDEGLVRLKTLDDLEDSEVEEEENEDANESSEGEDIKMLLGDEGDEDIYGSDEEREEEEEEEEEERGKNSSKVSKKRKQSSEDNKSKRTKLSSLPTFASAEDYAEYLQSSSDEE